MGIWYSYRLWGGWQRAAWLTDLQDADIRADRWPEKPALWTEVGEIAARLIERGYTGKAVLRVSGA